MNNRAFSPYLKVGVMYTLQVSFALMRGKAGSGKTKVLLDFIDYLRESRIKVGITAPTGVAASLVH